MDSPSTPFADAGERSGLVHIYTGHGKGKTTAAIGLAIRAAGQGLKVLFVQFFKPESDPAGEKEIFRKLPASIELLRPDIRHPSFTGPSVDISSVKKAVREAFGFARERAKEGFDMLVLDEIIGAINGGFIEAAEVMEFLDKRPKNMEVVLTGRDAPQELVKAADYVTEMLKIKHPYDKGIKGRRGVEY